MAPAASVGPSVPSVPAEKDQDVILAIDVDGCGQDKLLVTPPQAFAFDGDCGFPSGNETRRSFYGMTCPLDFPGQSCMNLGYFPGFTFHGRGENQRVVSLGFGHVRGGSQGQEVGADDQVDNVLESLLILFRGFFETGR